MHAWQRIASAWVRVTYVQEQTEAVVITVTIRRRGPEEK
jgi:hypothetical protein